MNLIGNKGNRKKKRLLLVKPPENSFFSFGGFSLAVLAAAVRHMSYVSILDCTTMTFDQAAQKIMAREPDIIGITLMGFSSLRNGVSLIQAITAAVPAGKPLPTIITGGHGAFIFPGKILEAGSQCVVFGEGELTLQDILRSGIRPGMPGTIVLSDGKIVRGEHRKPIVPMDRLETPARDLIAPPPNNMHLLETSRGCPHRCKFCETTKFFGSRWRSFSAERVVKEVDLLIEEYNGWIIQIADDNFTADIKRVKDICRRLLDEEILPAYFMLSARADDLPRDPELLPLMAQARMLRIQVGIDTLDPQLSQRVNKTISSGIYRDVFQQMRELGIFSVGSVIVGLPGESPEAREKILERVLEVAPDVANFVPYLPLPGLPRDEKHMGFNSHPDDDAEAARLNRDYYRHPAVLKQLEELTRGGDIQAQLAMGVLREKKIKIISGDSPS
jgi:anaerobic magnesium-protoporphyrin IX monomethyl ester cyclase